MSHLRPLDPSGECDGYSFWCPGCEQRHIFYTRHPNGGWAFNGDVERPTFSPSLLNTWTEPSGDKRCHLFVRDGQIEYCGDCHHALAGKTVPLAPKPPEAA